MPDYRSDRGRVLRFWEACLGVEVWIEYRQFASDMAVVGKDGLRNLYVWIGGTLQAR
jgi:hypothetical protein